MYTKRHDSGGEMCVHLSEIEFNSDCIEERGGWEYHVFRCSYLMPVRLWFPHVFSSHRSIVESSVKAGLTSKATSPFPRLPFNSTAAPLVHMDKQDFRFLSFLIWIYMQVVWKEQNFFPGWNKLAAGGLHERVSEWCRKFDICHASVAAGAATNGKSERSREREWECMRSSATVHPIIPPKRRKISSSQSVILRWSLSPGVFTFVLSPLLSLSSV